MCDAPPPSRSPSAQDAKGQTKISDYFHVMPNAQTSKRPGTFSQPVTSPWPAKRLKYNEGVDEVGANNSNSSPMDFETTEGDTLSYSHAMETGEPVTDETSAAVHVEKPNTSVTTSDASAKEIKMNPSNASGNKTKKNGKGGRKKKKNKSRQSEGGLDTGASLTTEGGTVAPSFATETSEPATNTVAIHEISPAKASISEERRVGKYSLRPIEKDSAVGVTQTKRGDTVSHSVGAVTGVSLTDHEASPAGEKPGTNNTTFNCGVKVKKTSSQERYLMRKARKQALRLPENDSEEDAAPTADNHHLPRNRIRWDSDDESASEDDATYESRVSPRKHVRDKRPEESAPKRGPYEGKGSPHWRGRDKGPKEPAPEREGKVSSSAQHTTCSMNLEFYRNKVRSVPDGDFIENILSKWKDDFRKLEQHHGYIQWLFPLKETGMNHMAQVLQEEEAKAIREDAVLKERVLRAYKMMLGFYGMVLKDDALGIVGPSDLFQRRMQNLNMSFHNNLRITRILKALGEFGFEHMKKPLLVFLIKEAFMRNTLQNCRRSCINFWIPTVEKKEEQQYLEKMVRDLEKKERRQTPDFYS